jgi:phosphoribosyl-ATP pyrophosphohydrolase
MTGFTLADLAAILDQRAKASPEESYTARLIAGGRQVQARKFGEEALEAVIAGLEGDRKALVGEAADVLYHLLVLLKGAGIGVDEVLAELQKRTSQSGLQEKASRGRKAAAEPVKPARGAGTKRR